MNAGRVVAGIDDSPAAEVAIRWAAAEAASRGAELHLVHAFIWPLFPVPLGASDMAPGLRAAADKIVQGAVETAQKLEPTLTVRGVRTDGFPAPVLISASMHADLVVIGTRSLGVALGALVGSTGLDLAANAHCPVVVVHPDQHERTGPVVIGYDGSAASSAALAFGLEHARRHALPVRVVAALTPSADHDLERELKAEINLGEQGANADLVLINGHPAEQVLRLSADAELVVLGSRGRGGFAGMMLGSVSQTVLQHATCPVVVIPAVAIGG